jgi:flagellar protein FlbD
VILVTRFNGSKLYINAEMIKLVEPIPDTVITLNSGEKFVVRDSVELVVERIIEYQRKVHTSFPLEKTGE